MPLSKLQQDYLNNCSHRWNLKTGATGSGKSWIDYSVVIPKRMLAIKGEGACLMLGNTQQTLNRNILEPMRNIWGEKLVSQIHFDNSIDCFGQKVYVLGADKITSVDRIRGMTLEYAYGDEMTTWNQDVFEMLKSRLRCPHSHFDGTMNPTDPNNFMKKFIDSDADIYHQTSTIDDNPFLPKEFVENLKKEYAGTIYYQRYILGLWAYAEGIIYRDFANAVTSADNRFLWLKDTPAFQKISIGVDFGGNGSKHAFVATGQTTTGQVFGLASRRIDPAETDADFLADEFISFARTVFETWGEISQVFCDSAEQVLIQHIRNKLRKEKGLIWLADRVFNSKKIEINDRIRLTTVLMGGGRFFYLPTAETLRDALSSCLWADKKAGVDVRLDDGSTDIDTLDAFEYTIERDYRRLLKWS